jgi:hypothetical protein
MNSKEYLGIIEKGVGELAISILEGYVIEAMQVSKEFSEKLKQDIARWLLQIQSGELSKQEFEWLLKAKGNLFEMQVLEQKGIARIKKDEFKEKVMNLLVDTAFTTFI